MQKKIRVIPKKKKIMPAVPQITSFPIVGIGASAGGLEAYQELLKNLSAKPGMAFVFIMHLAPGHKSMLTELLARLTKMPVREIKNGMPIEINHVYIIPPSTNVSITRGKLKLKNIEDAGLKRMPIDWFFRSLAEEQGNRAIGVILSGTLTDGTLGAGAIKAEGGIVFAQDEKSSKYDGMPQSAIAAGCVDFVLSPKKIAGELERIAKHPLISSAGPFKADKSLITEEKGIESIFDILRSAKGLDFTHYKTPTISRRISRRMVLLKLENLKDYIKFLRKNKDEVEKLYEDLLLKVTSFFRDEVAFRTLEEMVIPTLIKRRIGRQKGLRIWSAGCAMGQEPYSIAMLLSEKLAPLDSGHLTGLGKKINSQNLTILATDIYTKALEQAKEGVFARSEVEAIRPAWRKKYFISEGDSLQVRSALRELVTFKVHNLVSDPPYQYLDLVVCRNVLIYFSLPLQMRVLRDFYDGLNRGGFLLLGKAEAPMGEGETLFECVDEKAKLFKKAEIHPIRTSLRSNGKEAEGREYCRFSKGRY